LSSSPFFQYAALQSAFFVFFSFLYCQIFVWRLPRLLLTLVLFVSFSSSSSSSLGLFFVCQSFQPANRFSRCSSSNPRGFKTSFRLRLTADPASCRPSLLWSTHSCHSLFVFSISTM
jgi:hypothetical protein